MEIKSHEYWQLWRRRQGLTRKEVAVNLKIPYHRYRAIEKGQLPFHFKPFEIDKAEQIYLMRIRRDLTMQEIADMYEVSRQTIHKYESDQCPVGINEYEKWLELVPLPTS